MEIPLPDIRVPVPVPDECGEKESSIRIFG
jgi:hypothetical protein